MSFISFFKRKRHYSLHKSHTIGKSSYKIFRKKEAGLPEQVKNEIRLLIQSIDKAIACGDKQSASEAAKKLEQLNDIHFKKTLFDYAREFAFALIFALVIATIVRQMWFEFYEIPTGSMRPTFEEQDHLTVSKTAFGINIPLVTDHFYFDPDLVERMGVVTFIGTNLALEDTDTTCFWIFPCKKRYIKRLIGKPGDSLYFYGGKLYAIDKEGNELTDFLDSPYLKHLEHIPFLSFDGRIKHVNRNETLFTQMDLPAGRYKRLGTNRISGEVWDGRKWVEDNPTAPLKPHDRIETYSDIYGMRNFAMARLLNKKQLDERRDLDTRGLEEGILYLELLHTPSLNNPPPLSARQGMENILVLRPYSTVIPLQQRHIDALFSNLYTARFDVHDNYARRYSAGSNRYTPGSPRLQGVPNGTYEFYFGKAWKVNWGGILSALPESHPLYNKSPEFLQLLYNLGLDFNRIFSPSANNLVFFPNRYAYFRDGDLYLLGAPVIKKEDSTLSTFHEREKKRNENPKEHPPYIPFVDYGPPVDESGAYKRDFIRTFGVTVPEKHYLVLGDNHAMSADSRRFGFVPEENLQGAPSIIFWPPGDRFGIPMQKPYTILVLPRLIIWAIAFIIFISWYFWHRREMKKTIWKGK